MLERLSEAAFYSEISDHPEGLIGSDVFPGIDSGFDELYEEQQAEQIQQEQGIGE